MQDGLFFRVLRRVNLVMFTLIWIGALALGGFAIWKHGLPKHAFEKEAEFPISTEAFTPAYTLMPEAFGGQFYTNNTAPSIYVYSRSMTLADVPVAAYGGYSPGIAVNLMVIDDKGEGHWLFKTNKQQIFNRVAVRKGALAAPLPQGSFDVRPVIGLVMDVTDGAPATVAADAVPTIPPATKAEPKPSSIWLWKQGATEAVKLLDKVYLENSEQIGADRFHIVYSNGKVDRVAVYSVPDFEKLSDKPLPVVPK